VSAARVARHPDGPRLSFRLHDVSSRLFLSCKQLRLSTCACQGNEFASEFDLRWMSLAVRPRHLLAVGGAARECNQSANSYNNDCYTECNRATLWGLTLSTRGNLRTPPTRDQPYPQHPHGIPGTFRFVNLTTNGSNAACSLDAW
jgi:hypothetical protein